MRTIYGNTKRKICVSPISQTILEFQGTSLTELNSVRKLTLGEITAQQQQQGSAERGSQDPKIYQQALSGTLFCCEVQ